jgi:putative holliday junction resolvase
MIATTSKLEFLSQLPEAGSIMSLDYGSKNIGVAISDPNRKVAMPLCTLTGTSQKSQVPSVVKLINQYKACGIIIGLPLLLDGTEGPIAIKVREFAAELAMWPVLLHDERFSSKAARKLNTSKAVKASEDALAASILLEEIISQAI